MSNKVVIRMVDYDNDPTEVATLFTIQNSRIRCRICCGKRGRGFLRQKDVRRADPKAFRRREESYSGTRDNATW